MNGNVPKLIPSMEIYLTFFRCIWQEEAGSMDFSSTAPPLPAVTLPIEEDTELKLPSSPRKKQFPRIKLPTEIVQKLQNLSGGHAPQMRPSIMYVKL